MTADSAASSASFVRAAALRSSVFSLLHACSMGLKSGEYGGRNSSVHLAASMSVRAAATLCALRLSSTTTCPGGRSAGTSTWATNAVKTSRSVAASMDMQPTRPSSENPPRIVSWRQCPAGTRPTARSPRGARA
jgi:hypothetical protein